MHVPKARHYSRPATSNPNYTLDREEPLNLASAMPAGRG